MENQDPQNQLQQPAPSTASTAPEKPWTEGLSDPIVRDWVGKIGAKTPDDVAKKAFNLEKLLGHEKAGRTIVLPKDDDLAGQAEFFGKLGRPEKPEGYGFTEGDPEILGTFSKVMHENGITKKQAEALYKANIQLEQAHEQQHAERAYADIAELKREWGSQYEALADLADRARAEAGLSKEEGIAIERAIGVKKAAQLMTHFGQKLQEQRVITGKNETFVMTPQQANDRIAALKSDSEWVNKYLNGDKTKNEELQRLLKIAHG